MYVAGIVLAAIRMSPDSVFPKSQDPLARFIPELDDPPGIIVKNPALGGQGRLRLDG